MSRIAAALFALSAMVPFAVEASNDLTLRSNGVLVVDEDTGETLFSRNADAVVPIASLTKLMTALVVTEAQQPMNEVLVVSPDDVDHEKHTQSRLPVGARLTRSDALLLALMASENRAANALSRYYPGGRDAFLGKMNSKARALGMTSTHFADPAGLSSRTVSTARDLLRLVRAANAQELIRSDTTQAEATVLVRGRATTFVNTNRMVRNPHDWDIGLQKTGFTNDAGRCMVMRATTLNRRLSMVFLNSVGTLTRFADASRVRKQLERLAKGKAPRATQVASGAKASS